MLGLKIIYEPSAEVYHSHNESLFAVYRRSRRETVARELLYKQHQRNSKWYRIWVQSVVADMKFIQRNRESKKWLFGVPFYRLFWVMGR